MGEIVHLFTFGIGREMDSQKGGLCCASPVKVSIWMVLLIVLYIKYRIFFLLSEYYHIVNCIVFG